MQCLIKNNPIEIIQVQTEIKLQTAVNGTSLVTLKLFDKVKTQQAIANLIANLVQSLNLGNTLNEAQVVEIVYLLMERYYYLKLEELILIFKKAKMGDYGKNYNRLDIQVIFEWIELYYSSDERALFLEREAKNYKEQEKKPVEKKEIPEYAVKLIEQMKAEIPPSAKDEKREFKPFNESDFVKKLVEEVAYIDDKALNKLIKQCKMYKQERSLKILVLEKQRREQL